MRDLKNTELVQLSILQKKVNEYFSKNPKAKSVVFETTLGSKNFKCRVENRKGKLRISELKAVNEAPIGQVQNQENQAIQQAYQQALTPPPPPPAPTLMPPPPPPAPTLMPGPPMMPLATSPLPADAFPPMALPQVPPSPMPQFQAMPQAPVVLQQPTDPSMQMAPPPPEMQPQQTSPDQGPVNWDEVVANIEAAKAADPDGFKERFGATPQQQLQNPNVPPEVAVDIEPPNQRGGQKLDSFQPTLSEISTEYSSLTQQFTSALNDMNDATISQLTTMIQQVMPKLQDPLELKGAANMLNMLNLLKGSSDSSSTSFNSRTTYNATPFSFGEGKKKKSVITEQEDEIAMQDIPFNPGTAEEASLQNAMKGQTIIDVKVVNNANSFGVELNLAKTKWPAIFEFRRDGKVNFMFKNRRYTLQKKWN